MEPRPHREDDVRGYLERELRFEANDGIDHLELLKEECVLGERYEVWDCHTLASGRWWVVAPFTNLYSQDDFKSVDYLLSFHIGLMHRLQSRSEPGAAEKEFEEFAPIWRRWQQASDRFDTSEEAEDFQSVGMHLREALVTFSKHIADRSTLYLPPNHEALKRADFVGWATVVANAVASGDRNKHLRSYLKSIAKDGWQYVNWLTHAAGAIRADAAVGLQIVNHVITLIGIEMVAPWRRDPVEACAECGSYQLAHGRSQNDSDVPVNISTCVSCGWVSPAVETSDEPIQSYEADLDSPCTPSSDGPGKWPTSTMPLTSSDRRSELNP